ncbi:MAG: MBL fold metallo-hydrolase [Gammaproteobacteria bacterium]|nr:MBL fold metallo-hydrolase [Gammaproteobacteria bacterium]MCP5199057.1 MBL fold metallo-hydrolase [Gammaproteobacteria bacterium]
MNPEVRGFFDKATYTISYVVSDPETGRAAIIDSVLDFDPKSGRTSTASADELIAYIRDRNLSLDWILETHAHADHLSAAPYLKETLGGQVAIGEHITTVQETFKGVFNEDERFKTDGSQFDRLLADGDTFAIGKLEARVMHTPGHTPACISYLVGDALFVGDTLFMPDYGTARCDFPGGDPAVLYRSIKKLFELPDETRMFMCHDYMSPTRDFHAWETSVGEERRHNVHVHEGIGEDDFVRVRTARDKTLDMPVLILPSVQVNMRAGHKPPPEANGVSYLKLPMDLL